MEGRRRVVVVVVVVLVAGAAIAWAVSQLSSGPAGVGRRQSSVAGVDGRVRVEVLNAGGVSGLAGSATDALRDGGFDVVYFGNATSFDRDSSVVLDRVGTIEAAQGVADVLGIRNVRSEPDSNLYLDVSVLLGRDWQPPEEAQVEDDQPPRAWWDPRGWFGG